MIFSKAVWTGIVKFCFCLLFLLFSIGQPLFSAAPSSPCDYRPATSSFRDFRLRAQYNYFDDSNISSTGDVNRGTFATTYLNFFDSPSHSYRLSSDYSISFNKEDSSYNLTSQGSYNVYFAQKDFFGYGATTIEASSAFPNQFGLTLTTGLGLGRFKNVTPMTKAMRINQILVAGDVIRGNLTREALQKIADEIAKRGEPDELTKLVQAVENIIENTGQVKEEELNAVELLRLRDLLSEKVDTRTCGWNFKVGLGYEAFDPQGFERDIVADTSVDYALAFNPSTQFRIGSRLTTSLSIPATYSISGLLEYGYRINQQVDVQLLYSFLQLQDKGGSEFVSHSIDLRTDIQLGDDVSLAINITTNWETGYEELARGVSLDLTYDWL